MLLFYHTRPAIMRDVRARPAEAAKIVKKNIASIAKPLDKQDYPDFFAAQSDSIRRYQSLIGVDA